MRSVTQFILFIDEIFALPFDRQAMVILRITITDMGMKKQRYIAGAARGGRDSTFFPAYMQDHIEPNCLA